MDVVHPPIGIVRSKHATATIRDDTGTTHTLALAICICEKRRQALASATYKAFSQESEPRRYSK
jgi:hypothetical protein